MPGEQGGYCQSGGPSWPSLAPCPAGYCTPVGPEGSRYQRHTSWAALAGMGNAPPALYLLAEGAPGLRERDGAGHQASASATAIRSTRGSSTRPSRSL